MQAGDLIDAAKTRAYPGTGPEHLAEGSLLRHLESVDRDIVNMISQNAPLLLSEASRRLSVTSTRNNEGYRLEDAIAYTDFQTIDSDGHRLQITIIPERDFSNPATHPSGIISARRAGGNLRFFPADPQAEDWQGSETRSYYDPNEHEIEYRFVPAYEGLEKRSDELRAPQFARPLIEQKLVTQALLMQPDTSQARLQKAQQQENRLFGRFQMQMHKKLPIESRLGEDRQLVVIDPTS